ncbi:MAG: efflux RND transporter periplasmic adaptor subunit [Planctomycetia bacterium]|nr:efflux RND transporter periplasmic adaptor subunit [Planctomycetia bacterium]
MKHMALMFLVMAWLGFEPPAQLVDKSAATRNDAAPAAPEDGAVEQDAPGDLHMEDTLVTIIEEIEIPAKVEGVLSAVEAREGRMVESKAVIARIEDDEVRLTHERASTEFEIANKQAKNDLKVRISRKAADVARTELRRAMESNEIQKKSVSDAEIDRLRLAADKADLEIDQAVHEQETAELTSRLKATEMRLAQHAIDRRAIVSPIAGMVVQINSQRGEWVQAGKTVARVVRLDRLRVEGFVHSKFLTGDLVGRKVTLTVDLPGKPATEFSGAIAFVSPEIDPVNQTVRVWAEFENKKLLLRPGLRGKVVIHSEAPRGRP